MDIRNTLQLIPAFLAAGFLALRAEVPPAGIIQKMPLTENSVYMVGVAATPATTIMLPEAPNSFQGVGFTTSEAHFNGVFIEHTPGMNFFTVRALMKDAIADLNVIIGERIYAFRFYTSNKPVRALALTAPSKNARSAFSASAASPGAAATPEKLIELVDTAKSYFIIEEQNPGFHAGVELAAPGSVIEYNGFSVLVDFVWKFKKDDALVFRIVLTNKTPRPLYYDPRELGVRTGHHVYWQKVADASGVIPPAVYAKNKDTGDIVLQRQGQSWAYFAICGNPDGTRANISLFREDGSPANEFNILVNRIREENPNAR